jgi:hypothetical protein
MRHFFQLASPMTARADISRVVRDPDQWRVEFEPRDGNAMRLMQPASS